MQDQTFVRVHHSRVLRFIGRELPYMEMQRESYWGSSELEHLWDELQKHSASMAALCQAGLVSKPSALEEIKAMGKELGAFSNLELPEEPVQPFQQKPSNSVNLCPDAP